MLKLAPVRAIPITARWKRTFSAATRNFPQAHTHIHTTELAYRREALKVAALKGGVGRDNNHT